MKWFIKAVFKVVKILIRLLLIPLDTTINLLLPDLTDVFGYVGLFFDWITDFILWVKSWLPFTSSFYTALAGILIFYYSVPLTIHALKLVVKWYNALKP